MKASFVVVMFGCVLVLLACSKSKTAPVAPATSSLLQNSPAMPSLAPSQNDTERDQKQMQLDYAAMEDSYMNDPNAQWAIAASASSTFGDDNGATPSEVSQVSNVTGPIDGKTWTNNRQDIGFDWLQVGFVKPVVATEVRVVFYNGQGAEAVSKVELQDEQGQWTTAWAGLSDVKADQRGSRTWFVRKFAKAGPTKSIKISIANNVQRGYKVVDAVQLVGQ